MQTYNFRTLLDKKKGGGSRNVQDESIIITFCNGSCQCGLAVIYVSDCSDIKVRFVSHKLVLFAGG